MQERSRRFKPEYRLRGRVGFPASLRRCEQESKESAAADAAEEWEGSGPSGARIRPLRSVLLRGSTATPRAGRSRRQGCRSTCPRYGGCCRGATDAAPLSSSFDSVSLTPASKAGSERNFVLGEEHRGGRTSSGRAFIAVLFQSGLLRSRGNRLLHESSPNIEVPLLPCVGTGKKRNGIEPENATERRPTNASGEAPSL